MRVRVSHLVVGEKAARRRLQQRDRVLQPEHAVRVDGDVDLVERRDRDEVLPQEADGRGGGERGEDRPVGLRARHLESHLVVQVEVLSALGELAGALLLQRAQLRVNVAQLSVERGDAVCGESDGEVPDGGLCGALVDELGVVRAHARRLAQRRKVEEARAQLLFGQLAVAVGIELREDGLDRLVIVAGLRQVVGELGDRDRPVAVLVDHREDRVGVLVDLLAHGFGQHAAQLLVALSTRRHGLGR